MILYLYKRLARAPRALARLQDLYLCNRLVVLTDELLPTPPPGQRDWAMADRQVADFLSNL